MRPDIGKTLLIVLLLFPIYLKATHIVGGEFELIHLEGYNYEVRLIQYFDDFYGNPNAEDPSITASIFRKSDDQLIQSVVLINMGSSFVPYTNIDCTIDELSTRKIIYSSTVYLSPDIFNDPAGYYLVWERCCRNNVITNIQNPESAGQTFYLEFPPVVKNGEQFINSSPVLFPPLSDYACLDRFYYVDFRGRDIDGDSLVYSLVNPLAGYSSPEDPAPLPGPSPYPRVNWIPNIRVDNMVPGNEPLQISEDGLLTVTPSAEGLFVFSVLCEEYRAGVKIGEVRRDFQMLVIDCPEPGVPPSIKVKLKGEDQFYNIEDTIRFKAEDPKCVEVYVTDNDGAEKITFKAVPVNFEEDITDLLDAYVGQVENENDTLKMDICLPDCPLVYGDIAILDLIAMDDECSLPLMDTIRLKVDIEAVGNQAPYFTNPQSSIVQQLSEGDRYDLDLVGKDDDLDSLQFFIEPVNFELTDDLDISIARILQEPGNLRYHFSFTVNCDDFNFDEQDEFQFRFIIDDQNSCNFNNADTLNLTLQIDIPENNGPVISTDLEDVNVNARINEVVNFNVKGDDIDFDLVTLTAEGVGFDMEEVGMIFNQKSNFGSVNSPFTWRLNCDQVNLDQRDEYQVNFIASDNDVCRSSEKDTLSVNFRVRPPRNRPPSVFTEIFEFQTIRMQVGQTLDFRVVATDSDGDSIFLELADRQAWEEQLQVNFAPSTGFQRANTSFSWTATCEHLPEDLSPQTFDFKFYATDNKCYNNRSDTTTISIIFTDVPGEYEEFLPDNVFTPNGDGFNDYFFMPDLPNDNCRSEFGFINIFNRWGNRVFSSTKRDFQWDGTGNPPGVYYYELGFSKFKYRGTVSILK